MAIKGTGIDITEISRINNIVLKRPSFINRVFTELEINYFNSRGNHPCHIAGNFAAKEAVLKALGTGLRDMDWKDIEIARDSLGKPSVVLYGNACTIADNNGVNCIHISISHGVDYAVAQAIAEGD